MPDILLHLLLPIAASLLYAALGYHFWHTRWQNTAPPTPARQHQERLAILLPLMLHGTSLFDSLFGAGGMRFSFSLALSLMLWLAVLIYWLESFRSRVDGLQAMVLPVAALCAALPIAFPQMRLIAHAEAHGFMLHFLTAMLAYGLFTLSALHAIFMSLIERQLHHKEISPRFAHFPPLLAMETLLFHMITAAFLLLTVALASGLLFSEAIFGKALSLDHKTLFAFASWGIYAALLIGRRIYGWRGRIALRWSLTGFLLLFLAYIGSRFVLEVLLGRIA